METILLNRIKQAENYEQLRELVRVIDYNNIENDRSKRITNDDRNRLFVILINKAANIVEDASALKSLLHFIILHNTEVVRNEFGIEINEEIPDNATFTFKQNLIDKIVEILINKRLYILFLEFYNIQKIMDSFTKYKSRHNNIKNEFNDAIIEYFTNINNNNYNNKIADFINIVDTNLINQRIKFQCVQVVFNNIRRLSNEINIFEGNNHLIEMFFTKIIENYQSLGINNNINFKNSLEQFIFNKRELGFLIILFSNIFGKDFDAFINEKNPEEQAEISQNIRDDFEFYAQGGDMIDNVQNLIFIMGPIISKSEVIKNIILNKFLTNADKNLALCSLIFALSNAIEGDDEWKKLLYSKIFEIIRNTNKLNNSNNFSFTKQNNDCFNMEPRLKNMIFKIILSDKELVKNFSYDFMNYNFKNELINQLKKTKLTKIEKTYYESFLSHANDNKIEVSSFIKEKPLTSLLKIYENEYCDGHHLQGGIQQTVENFDATHDKCYIGELEDFFIDCDDLTESFAEFLSHDYFKNCFSKDTIKIESLTDILAELGVNCKAISNYLFACHEEHQQELMNGNNYNIQDNNNKQLTESLEGAGKAMEASINTTTKDDIEESTDTVLLPD